MAESVFQNISTTTSESLKETFLIDSSHCGDVIEKPQMKKITKDTNFLLSEAKGLDSEVGDFLNKILRLCEAAEREDNPIVFV